MVNPLTSTKTYWSILKSFLNNNKIPCILPLLHQNRYITKYKDKPNSVLFKQTENIISSINFSLDDITKIIQKLDPDKAHGHDMISIYML